MSKKTGLELLREPFEQHQISKLPKPTKKQTEEVKADYKKGIRCAQCDGWHHKDVVHLDYVGHAALTDRLLECDLNWNWEPLAFDEHGLPRFDKSGGLWIKLTVCGQTRFGYGNAEPSSNKDNGSREKEVIGDALRNAGMRFGAALDLWHKGDLHKEKDSPNQEMIDEPELDLSQEETFETALEGWGEESLSTKKPIPNRAEEILNNQSSQAIITYGKEYAGKKFSDVPLSTLKAMYEYAKKHPKGFMAQGFIRDYEAFIKTVNNMGNPND